MYKYKRHTHIILTRTVNISILILVDKDIISRYENALKVISKAVADGYGIL
jgi:hypothetical protein